MKKGSDPNYNGIDSEFPIEPPRRWRTFSTPAKWVIGSLVLGVGTLSAIYLNAGLGRSATTAVETSPRSSVQSLMLEVPVPPPPSAPQPDPSTPVPQDPSPALVASVPAPSSRPEPVAPPPVVDPVASAQPQPTPPQAPSPPVKSIPPAAKPTPALAPVPTPAVEPQPRAPAPQAAPEPPPAKPEPKAPASPAPQPVPSASVAAAPAPKPPVATPSPEPAPAQPRTVALAPRIDDFDYSGIELSKREARIALPEGLRKLSPDVLKEYLPITSKQWRKLVESLGADRETQLAKVPAPIREVFEGQRHAYMAKAVVMTCLKYPQREGCKTVKRSDLIEHADRAADYLGQDAKPLEIVLRKMAIKLDSPAPKASPAAVPKLAAKQKPRVPPTQAPERQEAVPEDCSCEEPEYGAASEGEAIEKPSEDYPDDFLEYYPEPARQPVPAQAPPAYNGYRYLPRYQYDSLDGDALMEPVVIPRDQVKRAIPVFPRY